MAQLPEVYRPRFVLVVAMGLATMLWAAVLGYLLTFTGIPLKVLLGASAFVLFFSVACWYYARTAIIVDAVGFTYRGMVRKLRVNFADIRNVHILPGPVTVYTVHGQQRSINFTSFFRSHRALMQLLVERSGLTPLRSQLL